MGDVTFRVCGGRQVMSSRVRRTKNPRTLPQMLQRVRFPNLVATYRAFRGGMKDCFERTGVPPLFRKPVREKGTAVRFFAYLCPLNL